MVAELLRKEQRMGIEEQLAGSALTGWRTFTSFSWTLERSELISLPVFKIEIC